MTISFGNAGGLLLSLGQTDVITPQRSNHRCWQWVLSGSINTREDPGHSACLWQPPPATASTHSTFQKAFPTQQPSTGGEPLPDLWNLESSHLTARKAATVEYPCGNVLSSFSKTGFPQPGLLPAPALAPRHPSALNPIRWLGLHAPRQTPPSGLDSTAPTYNRATEML